MATQHSVTLNWTAAAPGSDPATGYNAYRGVASGGPYSKLNASPVAATTFTDSSGAAGTKYFYVVTSLDAQGNESTFSNESSAVMAQNPNAPSGLTASAA